MKIKMNINYILSLWRTIKIPGLAPVMRDWSSFLRLHFLYAALESGLLHALQNGADRQDLIQTLHVRHPELLDALLDLGLALGELSRSNLVFHLKGKRAKILATPRGDALAALIQGNVTYYNDAYRRLADRLRGAPLGDDLLEIGETVARFSKICEPILKNFIQSMAPSSGCFRLLDVGCGSGFVLETAGKINAGVSGIGIDSDDKVAEQARRNLEQWGGTDRFTILTGDIRTDIPAGPDGFDLITAFNLIYYIPRDERPEFLGRLHSLLRQGGRLALANTFESKGTDAGAANLNIVNCSLNNLVALPNLEDLKSQLSLGRFDRIKVTRFIPGREFYGITAQAA
ncbi:MAG: class I SAM-dependent methyltransferase [Pseudomonadota bacterium]